MRRVVVICLLATAWLSHSCTDCIAYHAYHPFAQEGWNKRDTLWLDIQMTDSIAGNVQSTLLVRNNSVYPYQDFTTVVQHNFPDTTRWRSYKITFTLADPDGKWSGSGIGGLYQSSVLLGEASIAHPAKYTFKLVHQMNDERLSGISDIGVVIKKEKQSP